MNKIILIPDSFKGTMSSVRICEILGRAVREILPGEDIIPIPIADGGEGTVDAFLAAAGGERRSAPAPGPNFEDIGEVAYAMLPDGTAVIEMAAAAGLPLCKELDPMRASTYGVGLLMAEALISPCKRIILGLGGSATNDGGCGAAWALGARFYDRAGNSFIPNGGTLEQIDRIDLTDLRALLGDVPVTCICDVDNPMCGENGAAAVFAPQKGATPEQVRQIDRGLRHLAEKLKECTGRDVLNLPGAGAAGGMGGGFAAMAGAELKHGIDIMLDTIRFDTVAKGADLILTGEGKIDSQSVRGKVVCGVAKRAKTLKIPCIAIVGDAEDGYESLYDEGLTAVFPINRTAIPFEQAQLRAEEDLYRTACDVLRLVRRFAW